MKIPLAFYNKKAGNCRILVCTIVLMSFLTISTKTVHAASDKDLKGLQRDVITSVLSIDKKQRDEGFQGILDYALKEIGESKGSKDSKRIRSGSAAEYRGSGQESIDYLNRTQWYHGGIVEVLTNGIRFSVSGKQRFFSFHSCGGVVVEGRKTGWFAAWHFGERWNGRNFVNSGEDSYTMYAGKFENRKDAIECASHMVFLSPNASKIVFYGPGPGPKVSEKKPHITSRQTQESFSFSWRAQSFDFRYPGHPDSKVLAGKVQHTHKSGKYGVWMDMTIIKGENQKYPDYKQVLIASPKTGEKNVKGTFCCDNVTVHYEVVDLVWNEGAPSGTWGPGAPHFSGTVHIRVDGSPIQPRQTTGGLFPIASKNEALDIVRKAAKLNSEKDTWTGTSRYSIYPDRIEKAFTSKSDGRTYHSTHYYRKIYQMSVNSSSGWLYVNTLYEKESPGTNRGHLGLGWYQGDKDAITRILLAVSYLAKECGRSFDVHIEPYYWRKRIRDYEFARAQEKMKAQQQKRQAEIAEQLKQIENILDKPRGSGWHGRIGDRPANLEFPCFADKSLKNMLEIATKHPSDRYNKNGRMKYTRTGNKLKGFLKIGNNRTGVEEGNLVLELTDSQGGKALIGSWNGMDVRFELVHAGKCGGFNLFSFGGL